jgi:TolB-like protein/Tfp pilus assembly protein PilF
VTAARGTKPRADPEGHRLAVLPLVNVSPDPKDEYFTDGMTDELISTLSRIPSLRVIARTSVIRYKGSPKSVAEVGHELKVRTVLEGSVRKSGSRIRMTVQLVDAETEERIWSDEYDRELEDVFAIQRDIAQRIAKALKVRIAKDVRQRGTPRLDAYALYLKGRLALASRSESSLRQAVDHFERAIALDSAYALAYTGLSDANAVQALLEFLPPHDAFPRAKAAAERALEIDPSLAEAHTSLGVVRFQYEWDWSGAERAFRRAIELNPNYAPAHQFYADYLKAMGRFDEAVGEMHRAQELDPLSISITTGLGHVLYLSREYDRAIDQYRTAVALDPSFVQAHLWFGRPYLQKGMFDEAIAELDQAVKLSGGSTMSIAMLGHASASAGRTERAVELLETLKERSTKQYVPSYWIGLLYVGLGDKDHAIEWLERAFRERSSWLAWIGVEPRFDSLRSDPRFIALVGRMRFPERAQSPTGASAQAAEARSLLSDMTTITLSRYRVVGEYLRYGETARNLLKDLKQKIVAGIEAPSRSHANFLIWSPPGSGKTFFVEQLMHLLGPSIEYHEGNLAALDERGFRSMLSSVQEATGPCLCFIDEADSKATEAWPQEALLVSLDANLRSPKGRAFILAGSSGPSLSGMKANLVSRPKGADVLSRIPPGSEYEIPPMTVGDRIVIALATIQKAGKESGRTLSEVEKLALYYIALSPQLGSARRLREFSLRAMGRIPAGEDRLKFDNLFDPGDSQSKEFWMAARTAAPNLINSFVLVDE